eukprot:2544940-Pleurochrysis_carterae.AAC.1
MSISISVACDSAMRPSRSTAVGFVNGRGFVYARSFVNAPVAALEADLKTAETLARTQVPLDVRDKYPLRRLVERVSIAEAARERQRRIALVRHDDPSAAVADIHVHPQKHLALATIRISIGIRIRISIGVCIVLSVGICIGSRI